MQAKLKILLLHSGFAGICLAAISMLAYISVNLLLKYDTTQPESTMVWTSGAISLGDTTYTDWREWPHRIMPYGPLLCYPIGKISRLAGSPGIDFHLYIAGRLQSLMYALAAMFLVGRVLDNRGLQKRWAYVLPFGYMMLWTALLIPAFSFRPDYPAVFWAILASYVVFRNPNSWKWISIASMCFVVSLAYKLSCWALPLAVCLFFISQRRIKAAVAWAGLIALMTLAYTVFGYLVWGDDFLLNQVLASSAGFDTGALKTAWTLLISNEPFPLLTWDTVARMLASVVVALFLIRKTPGPLETGFSIYYLAALVINIAGMTKTGAGLNYLIEPYLLSAIVAGLGALHIFRDQPGSKSRLKRATALTILVFAVLPLPRYLWVNVKATLDAAKLIAQPSVYQPVQELPDTALLCELAGYHPSYNSHALSDPLSYSLLSNKGLIDKEILADRIREKQFSHIVLGPTSRYLFNTNAHSAWVGELIEQNYDVQTTSPEFDIWTRN